VLKKSLLYAAQTGVAKITRDSTAEAGKRPRLADSSHSRRKNPPPASPLCEGRWLARSALCVLRDGRFAASSG
jgi:hypothetical protein